MINVTTIDITFTAGMHKKSLEATEKLKDMDLVSDDISPDKEKEEMKTESINNLRAKAQQHNAKILAEHFVSGVSGANNSSCNQPHSHTVSVQQGPQSRGLNGINIDMLTK